MPHITVETNVTLDLDAKKKLIQMLNDAIPLIPGKSADRLMIALQDGMFMSFGERKDEKFMHMNVLIYLAASCADKQELVTKYTEVAREVAGIKAENVYITIQDLGNWGVGGIYK